MVRKLPPAPWTAALLKRFDDPHRKLHALAGEVKALQDRGDYAAASLLVTGTGAGTLSTMVDLFGELRETYQGGCREMVLALSVEGVPLAIAADSVLAVDNLRVGDLPPGATTAGDLVRRVGRRADSKKLVAPGSGIRGNETRKIRPRKASPAFNTGDPAWLVDHSRMMGLSHSAIRRLRAMQSSSPLSFA